MNRIILGNRDLAPAFYDMGCRFRPNRSGGWYGGPFRIGDRAAAHVWLADWRKRAPQRKLVVVEDSVMPGTEHSRALPGKWLFDGIADEVWVVEHPKERIARPAGQTLYHVTMWRIWRWLMFNKIVEPTIMPTVAAMKRADEILAQYGVPPKFTTVQPLFDAGYDKYRNAPADWWRHVIHQISIDMPVVVLGLPNNARKMQIKGDKVHPIWETPMDAMVTLAIIAKAAAHVGGATGTTLWAPIFKVPTLACYVYWGPHPGKKTDTRPLSFGSPVVYANLSGDIKSVALKAAGLYNGTTKGSTPVG